MPSSPPAPCSCKHPEPHLPSIFLAFSISKKSSWWDIEEWVWCQGCWEFPSKKAECILQKKGCARMGRTDGWTCRTSSSHKRSEHRKRSVAFLSFFLKAEIYLGSTCSNYRLGQILTSGNRAGGKKILWRAQACAGPCCICPTIISGATLAAGWNVAVNRKYTIRVLKYESGAGTKSRQQTDFPC